MIGVKRGQREGKGCCQEPQNWRCSSDCCCGCCGGGCGGNIDVVVVGVGSGKYC